MKKIIYIVLLSIASNLILASCTEEKVDPVVQMNTIGNPSDDKSKP